LDLMMATMPFGKHKGQSIDSLPFDYLQYLETIPLLASWLTTAVREEIERRRARKQHSENKRHSENGHTGHFAWHRKACPDCDVARELIAKGLRALAIQHHPDRGGDTEKMKRVNVVADWLRKQVDP
jgi:hypothetical protein